MKILKFKVPYKVVRNSDNTIDLTILDNDKELDSEESLSDHTETDIPTIVKQLSDWNERQKSIANLSMSKSSDNHKGFLILKYLGD